MSERSGCKRSRSDDVFADFASPVVTEEHQRVGDLAYNAIKERENTDLSTLVNGFSLGYLKDAAVGGTESLDDLIKSNTKAPGSTDIIAKPAGDITAYMVTSLSQIQLLLAFATVYSNKLLLDDHPDGFDLSNPSSAAQQVIGLANKMNIVLLKYMGSYLSPSGSTTFSQNKTVATADLHVEFIASMFKSFNFNPAGLAQLDSILNNVVKGLSNLRLSFAKDKLNFHHCVKFFFFEDVMGAPGLKTLTFRMFYLQIDDDSWKVAVAKSSVQEINWKMSFVDSKFLLNGDQVKRDTGKIQGVINQFTSLGFDELKKIANAAVVDGIGKGKKK